MGGKKHTKKAKKPKDAKGAAAAALPVVPPAASFATRSFYVFDRLHTAHPWARGLETSTPSQLTHQAIQQNWRMDARVEPRREEMLKDAAAFSRSLDSYGQWIGAVETHYRTQACRVFEEPTNANNRIDRATLPPHEELLHVVSLGRLFGFLNWKHGGSFAFELDAEFPKLPVVPDGNPEDPAYRARVWDWAEQLNLRGLAEVQRLAGWLADQLGDLEPPWWAGFAEELEPVLAANDWVELCRLLGVGHLQEGEALLVFRYPVERAFETGKNPFRPTSVEASSNPCHFPSPSGEKFGYTMPLSTKTRRYCREIIHAPLKGDLAASSCVSPVVRLNEPVLLNYNALSSLRRRQRKRLEKEVPGADLRAWLGRHPAI